MTFIPWTSTQSLCRLTARWPAPDDFSLRVLPPFIIVSSAVWSSRPAFWRWPWEKLAYGLQKWQKLAKWCPFFSLYIYNFNHFVESRVSSGYAFHYVFDLIPFLTRGDTKIDFSLPKAKKSVPAQTKPKLQKSCCFKYNFFFKSAILPLFSVIGRFLAHLWSTNFNTGKSACAKKIKKVFNIYITKV